MRIIDYVDETTNFDYFREESDDKFFKLLKIFEGMSVFEY
jgi:hypothetical protein